jgi:hypothetical protein
MKLEYSHIPTNVGVAVDSGAFTFMNKASKKAKGGASEAASGWTWASEKARVFGYFKTKEFDEYLARYIKFLHQNESILDFYVTLDVIGNAEMSWELQQVMEQEGLNPLPVLHFGVEESWIKHYLDRYEYIGLGGFGTAGKNATYVAYLDRIFNKYFLDEHNHPRVKLHGFGLATLELLDFPWYSFDSSTWAQMSFNGVVMTPKYHFDGSGNPIQPRWLDRSIKLFVMPDSKYATTPNRHYDSLSPSARAMFERYVTEDMNGDLERLRLDGDYRNALNFAYFVRRQIEMKRVFEERWGYGEGGNLYFAGAPGGTVKRMRNTLNDVGRLLVDIPNPEMRFLISYVKPTDLSRVVWVTTGGKVDASSKKKSVERNPRRRNKGGRAAVGAETA